MYCIRVAITYSIQISFDYLYSTSEEQENGPLTKTQKFILYYFITEAV